MKIAKEIGKRAARAILSRAVTAIEDELPMINTELLMEESNQHGGMRLHRLSHSLTMEGDIYVLTQTRYVDRDEARRLMNPPCSHSRLWGDSDKKEVAIDNDPTQLGTID